MVEVGYDLKHIEMGRMFFYFQETEEVKVCHLMLIIFRMIKLMIQLKLNQRQKLE